MLLCPCALVFISCWFFCICGVFFGFAGLWAGPYLMHMYGMSRAEAGGVLNMVALGLTDLFYLGGRFLGMVDPVFVLVGLLGLIMTGLGLIGNLARLERRIGFIEIDALLLLLVYIGGLLFLYGRGVAP